MTTPQPRVLGGFAVIPTGTTVTRDVHDLVDRAQIIVASRAALSALDVGLLDARDETALKLRYNHGWEWRDIARLFGIRDASSMFETVVRRRARLAMAERWLERSRDFRNVHQLKRHVRAALTRDPDTDARSPRPSHLPKERTHRAA